MKRRVLILSLTLNLVFLIGLLAVVGIKGGFDYLWLKTSSMIRGQGLMRDYNHHYFDRKKLFAQMPQRAEDVLIIGDSLVEYGDWAELLENPNIRNRGILGDSVLGVLHRIEEHMKPVAPRKIYLMVGINDLFGGVTEDRIIANYEDVLKSVRKLSANCEIIVQGLLPIEDSLSGVPKQLSSMTIHSLNSRLAEMCNRRNILFVDAFEHFDQDGDNRLDQSFSYDGLHLNGTGYLQWARLLQLQEDKSPR